MLSKIKRFLRNCLGQETYAGVKIVLRKEIFQGIDIKCRTEMHGTTYGGWSIIPQDITKDSVVYSFGIGNDVSFDLSLIEKYGVTVHAFDPTPESIAWAQNQTLPEELVIHEYGVWSDDGLIDLFAPNDSSAISHTITTHAKDRFSNCQRKIRVKTVGTIMQELRHTKIDILKMDIEGAEYEVLDDIVNHCIPIRQLLVEFHHFFPGIGVGETRRSLEKLNAANYKVFYVDPRRHEFSLVSDYQKPCGPKVRK